MAIAALAAFLIAAPDGLLTKADVIGSAVCHRWIAHSFVIGGRQLPLCARCTGTFPGALVGFFGQGLVLRRRRAAHFPSLFILVILIGFMLLWAADGLNSFMSIFPDAPHLYAPQNWLRLATGALNGLAMSALVYPVLNSTLWRQPAPERTIRSLRDLGVLVLLEAGMVGLVLTQWAWLLYPLALLSALGVLTLLTSVNSMLVVMLVRRENAVDTWREAAIPLLVGFTLSLMMVATIDFVRYALTGTLSGIPLLQ
jgi:uncharacterized membrane protein